MLIYLHTNVTKYLDKVIPEILTPLQVLTFW